MVAIITGDIIASRKLKSQKKWLKPIKSLFNEWGKNPGKWEIMRGDGFQIEIERPEDALLAALRIKALIKTVITRKSDNRKSLIDVRMAIGIGNKDYSARRISESNGPAFVFSGEKFETLKKEKNTLALRSDMAELDETMNLYLRFAQITMDNWSVTSGELMCTILKNPQQNQVEIGAILGIEQSSVSGRYKRARVDEILALERYYRKRILAIGTAQ